LPRMLGAIEKACVSLIAIAQDLAAGDA
jgi:hypothetical protein